MSDPTRHPVLLVAVAGLVTIACLALVGPWDPQGISLGFLAALLVAAGCLVLVGRLSSGRGAIAAGALFGFGAAAAFQVGTFVVYDYGLYGHSWAEFGDSDFNAVVLIVGLVVWGVPAALAGSLLALLGFTTRHLGAT